MACEEHYALANPRPESVVTPDAPDIVDGIALVGEVDDAEANGAIYKWQMLWHGLVAQVFDIPPICPRRVNALVEI
jgi:hypothetical protein